MAMRALIRVELIDGTVCRMAPKALNAFLRRGQIAQFERSTGWAVVGQDPLRGMGERNNYCGYEQRMAV